MSAAWIQGLAILAAFLAVLTIVFYSMCVAAHEADEAVDAEANEFEATRQAESEACATSTANLVLVLLAACAFGAAQVWLPGPTEAQAQQDIADSVAALEKEEQAAQLTQHRDTSVVATTR